MSSFEQLRLQQLVTTDQLAPDMIKCIVNTIVFGRALGMFEAEDGHIGDLGVSYPRCKDAAIYRQIETQIDSVLKTVRKTKRSDTCNIALSFYEKRQTTRLFGLGTATEEVLWEQWILNFKFVQTVNIEEVANELTKLLREVTSRIANKTAHVPMIPKEAFEKSGVIPFPFVISLDGQTSRSGGILSELFFSKPV